jgi:hypothetical protein
MINARVCITGDAAGFWPRSRGSRSNSRGSAGITRDLVYLRKIGSHAERVEDREKVVGNVRGTDGLKKSDARFTGSRPALHKATLSNRAEGRALGEAGRLFSWLFEPVGNHELSSYRG